MLFLQHAGHGNSQRDTVRSFHVVGPKSKSKINKHETTESIGTWHNAYTLAQNNAQHVTRMHIFHACTLSICTFKTFGPHFAARVCGSPKDLHELQDVDQEKEKPTTWGIPVAKKLEIAILCVLLVSYDKEEIEHVQPMPGHVWLVFKTVELGKRQQMGLTYKRKWSTWSSWPKDLWQPLWPTFWCLHGRDTRM